MRGLLAKLRGRAPSADPAIPTGHRAYAIGDVHGRLDLMDDLIARVRADDAARPKARTHLIFLGDLIDRGPQSAAILERLSTRPPEFAECHFISGNHEEALIDSLRGTSAGREGWLAYGGRETLQSYGIGDAAIEAGGFMLDQEMHSAIPTAHLDFVESFHRSIRLGDYLFVHAGIRPGVPLDRQLPEDLHWIREDFLDDDSDHGVVVVHGHTITEAPVFRANRVGIDTGAYRSGVLTALGLEGTDRWLVQTG